MPTDLNDRVILITGASSGIGAATAIAAAQAGMKCVLTGRDAERLEAVAARVRHGGGAAETLVGDVAEPDFHTRLLDLTTDRYGRFDVVFANAGYGYKQAAHLMPLGDVRRMFEVNFFASYALLQDAARRLIAAKQPGHLLMCSSALAKFTMINFSAYSASKAAQNHVCRAMDVELRPHRIRVSSVHPITTRTDFFRRSGELSGTPGPPGREFDHVPRWMLQDADTVARAVMRCLRRPRPEVWTSTFVRTVAGVITVLPRLADAVAVRG